LNEDLPVPDSSLSYINKTVWHAACSITNRLEKPKEAKMLWTIALVLVVLWVLGLTSAYTAGGLIHLLLVVAVIVVIFQFLSGRRLT
jgi:fatty acid desaturase